jgi:hypothetical protein
MWVMPEPDTSGGFFWSTATMLEPAPHARGFGDTCSLEAASALAVASGSAEAAAAAAAGASGTLAAAAAVEGASAEGASGAAAAGLADSWLRTLIAFGTLAGAALSSAAA